MDGTLTMPVIDFAEMRYACKVGSACATISNQAVGMYWLRRRCGVLTGDVLDTIASWPPEKQHAANQAIKEVEEEVLKHMQTPKYWHSFIPQPCSSKSHAVPLALHVVHSFAHDMHSAVQISAPLMLGNLQTAACCLQALIKMQLMPGLLELCSFLESRNLPRCTICRDCPQAHRFMACKDECISVAEVL